MFKFLDELLKLGITLFLLVALLPFYFFVLSYLKGVIKPGKSSKGLIVYILTIVVSVFTYIFLINIVVKQFL